MHVYTHTAMVTHTHTHTLFQAQTCMPAALVTWIHLINFKCHYHQYFVQMKYTGPYSMWKTDMYRMQTRTRTHTHREYIPSEQKVQQLLQTTVVLVHTHTHTYTNLHKTLSHSKHQLLNKNLKSELLCVSLVVSIPPGELSPSLTAAKKKNPFLSPIYFCRTPNCFPWCQQNACMCIFFPAPPPHPPFFFFFFCNCMNTRQHVYTPPQSLASQQTFVHESHC